MKSANILRKAFPFTVVCAVVGIGSTASAQSRWNNSIVGISQNGGNGIYVMDGGQFTDGTPSTASVQTSFTGMDGNGLTQTMGFTGFTATSAQYGQLHSQTSLSVTNSYWNAANPQFFDTNTHQVNPNGSPDSLVSLGFAGFNDTLQFGGALQAGYQARYVFHVDGTNSGPGAMADMAFGIDGYTDESFFATNQGVTDTVWGTQSYAINGQSPQNVHVQFSTQYVFDAFTNLDGTNESGFSNFGSTLTLDRIEILDANGHGVSGVTVTSGSGTVYNVVPEPEVPVTLALGVGSVLFLRRRRF